MFANQIPDKSLLRSINKNLQRTGTNSKIVASVKSGYVTLTGVLQYENQRRNIVRVTNQVNGVRHVVDQMTVRPPKRVE
jgi:osmotically-inducible protein OsmY